MSGNEASAISSLRTINSGESAFSSSCGGNGYAQTLDDLRQSPIGTTVGFFAPDLATNGITRSGFVVSPYADTGGAALVMPASKTCNGSAADAVSAYFAEAHPLTVGETGQRSFATDTRGAIYFNGPGVTMTPGMAAAVVLR